MCTALILIPEIAEYAIKVEDAQVYKFNAKKCVYKVPLFQIERIGEQETVFNLKSKLHIGDVHFIMLECRYYRNPNGSAEHPKSMLGPQQKKWLLDTVKLSKSKFKVLCSSVPWTFIAKGDSPDTWNGYQEERNEIFDFLADNKINGVVLMSADRHRSDLWKIERDKGYPLYEFNCSRLAGTG